MSGRHIGQLPIGSYPLPSIAQLPRESIPAPAGVVGNPRANLFDLIRSAGLAEESLGGLELHRRQEDQEASSETSKKDQSVAGSETSVPLPLESFLQIDPPEQQRQLLPVEADAHRIRPGPPEGALFKTTVAQPIPTGFPEQHLEAVSLPIRENIDAAAQGILPQRLTHQSREPIEGLAKVHRIGGHKDGRGGQERRHHGRHPRASSNWRNCCGLNLSGTRNDLPADQAMTKPSCILLARSKSIRTGTNLGFKTGPSANSLCDPVWPPSLE